MGLWRDRDKPRQTPDKHECKNRASEALTQPPNFSGGRPSEGWLVQKACWEYLITCSGRGREEKERRRGKNEGGEKMNVTRREREEWRGKRGRREVHCTEVNQRKSKAASARTVRRDYAPLEIHMQMCLVLCSLVIV